MEQHVDPLPTLRSKKGKCSQLTVKWNFVINLVELSVFSIFSRSHHKTNLRLVQGLFQRFSVFFSLWNMSVMKQIMGSFDNVLPMNRVRVTVWISHPFEITGGVPGWQTGISLFPTCLQSGWQWEFVVVVPLPVCHVLGLLLVLGRLKPLGTLSPPCCKTGWSLVVLKLALQASSEGCRKTGGGVSRCLSCSPDLLQCFQNLKLKQNISYFWWIYGSSV